MKGACLGDDTVLAFVGANVEAEEFDQVREHLDGCDECRRMVAMLGRSIYESGPDAPAPPAQRVPTVGTQVGRYVITGLLGKGGMALVFTAYDPELRRNVALKLLRPDRDDAKREQRFLREAKAMAQLTHPNVIRIFDAGADAGRLFIAMQHVEGTTLAGWLRDGAPAWQEVVRAFHGAGSGLAAAHEAGIVHRDFKPANVLMSSKGDVMVTDFGLACTSGVAPRLSSSEDPTLVTQIITAAGAVVGTPAYMAPEQFTGPADERSDQFAFSVALYEALYRVHPFARALRSGAPALLGTLDPSPPSPAVPPELFAVVWRGMSRQPDARFASMSELLAALEDVLEPRTELSPTIPLLAATPTPVPQSSPGATLVASPVGRAVAAGAIAVLLASLAFVVVRILVADEARAETAASPASSPAPVPAPMPAPAPVLAPPFAPEAVAAAAPEPEPEPEAEPEPDVVPEPEPDGRREIRRESVKPVKPRKKAPAAVPDGVYRSVYDAE